MYNTLNEIKTQLFDAPIEVKEAFNALVEYFDARSSAKSIMENSQQELKRNKGKFGDPSKWDSSELSKFISGFQDILSGNGITPSYIIDFFGKYGVYSSSDIKELLDKIYKLYPNAKSSLSNRTFKEENDKYGKELIDGLINNLDFKNRRWN